LALFHIFDQFVKLFDFILQYIKVKSKARKKKIMGRKGGLDIFLNPVLPFPSIMVGKFKSLELTQLGSHQAKLIS